MFRALTVSVLTLLFPVLLSCEKPEAIIPDTPQEQIEPTGNTTEETPTPVEASGKTLVVYYSFTGN